MPSLIVDLFGTIITEVKNGKQIRLEEIKVRPDAHRFLKEMGSVFEEVIICDSRHPTAIVKHLSDHFGFTPLVKDVLGVDAINASAGMVLKGGVPDITYALADEPFIISSQDCCNGCIVKEMAFFGIEAALRGAAIWKDSEDFRQSQYGDSTILKTRTDEELDAIIEQDKAYDASVSKYYEYILPYRNEDGDFYLTCMIEAYTEPLED